MRIESSRLASMRVLFQWINRFSQPMKLLMPRKDAIPTLALLLLVLFAQQKVLVGAFTATAQWDVRSTATAADVNGGGFDTGVAGFPTDGAATVATTSAPVFTSASYNFVAGDVGAWIYIGAGTNWIQGWYKIASVASNAATLTAGIGTATLSVSGSPMGPNIVVGCATTASPTGATWGIDYSQQDAAQIAFTDMVIGGTTTTFTSVLKPVGKNFIGNVINVVSGTNFTVQRVAVVSTSGTTATCDKSLGTAAATGGHGNLGGSLLTFAQAVTLTTVAGQKVHIKAGTYTQTTTQTLANISWAVIGYNTAHVDAGTKPLITTATNSIPLWQAGVGAFIAIRNISFSNTAGTRSRGIQANGSFPTYAIQNCIFDGFSIAIAGNGEGGAAISDLTVDGTEVKNSTGAGITEAFRFNLLGSYIHDNTGDGADWVGGGSLGVHNTIFARNAIGLGLTSTASYGSISNSIFYKNTGTAGLSGVNGSDLAVMNSVFYGNVVGITGLSNMLIDRNNAFGSNSGGDRTSGSGISQYTIGQINLTADPFVSSTNFALNTTAGGGAALKQAGFPGVFPAGLSTGYLDVGAVQTSGAPGSGGAFAAAFTQ